MQLNHNNMKRLFLTAILLFSVGLAYVSAQSTNVNWTEHKAKKWFKGKEWLNGLAANPHSSID
jgi:hypothetical protein